MKSLRNAAGATLLLASLLSFAESQDREDCPDIGPVVKISTGFHFTEGPVADQLGTLYFTDQRDGNGKIYRLDLAGHLDVLVDNSDRANGLALNPQGELVACQMNGRVVAYQLDGSACRVLASGYCNRRFNAPNDLVIDRDGGIYFTDPLFGAPRPFPPQGRAAVYYLSPGGDVTRLVDDLANPNGIDLSPDEKTLYVVPSMQRQIMAYAIEAPGKLGPGRVFATMARSAIPLYRGGDGMAVDECGRLYVATQRGVQIFAADGRLLTILKVPERPSNVAFGGVDRKTLVITAMSSVYVAATDVAGR